MAINVYDKPLLSRKEITPWELPADLLKETTNLEQQRYDTNRNAFLSVLNDIQNYKARPNVKEDMDFVKNLYNQYKTQIEGQLDPYGQNFGMLSPEALIRATDEVLMPNKEKIVGIAQNYYYWELEEKMEAEMRAAGKNPLFRNKDLQTKSTIDSDGNILLFRSTVEGQNDWADIKEKYFEPVGSHLKQLLGDDWYNKIISLGGYDAWITQVRQDNKAQLQAVIDGATQSYIKENSQEFRFRTQEYLEKNPGMTQQEAEQKAFKDIQDSFLWRAGKRQVSIATDQINTIGTGTGSTGGKGTSTIPEDDFTSAGFTDKTYTVLGVTPYEPENDIVKQVNTYFGNFDLYKDYQSKGNFLQADVTDLQNLQAGLWKAIMVGDGTSYAVNQDGSIGQPTKVGTKDEGFFQSLGNVGDYYIGGEKKNPAIIELQMEDFNKYVQYLETDIFKRSLSNEEKAVLLSRQVTYKSGTKTPFVVANAIDVYFDEETGEYQTRISPFAAERMTEDERKNAEQMLADKADQITKYKVAMKNMRRRAENLKFAHNDIQQNTGWTDARKKQTIERNLATTPQIDLFNKALEFSDSGPLSGNNVNNWWRKQLSTQQVLVDHELHPIIGTLKLDMIDEMSESIEQNSHFIKKELSLFNKFTRENNPNSLADINYADAFVKWASNNGFQFEELVNMGYLTDNTANYSGNNQNVRIIDGARGLLHVKTDENGATHYYKLSNEIANLFEYAPNEITLSSDKKATYDTWKQTFELTEEEKQKRVPLIINSDPAYRAYNKAIADMGNAYNIQGYVFNFTKDAEKNNYLLSTIARSIKTASENNIQRVVWDEKDPKKRSIDPSYSFATERQASIIEHAKDNKSFNEEDLYVFEGVRFDVNNGWVIDFKFKQQDDTEVNLEYNGYNFTPQQFHTMGIIPDGNEQILRMYNQISSSLSQNNYTSGEIGQGLMKMPFFVALSDGPGYKKGNFYTYDHTSNNTNSRIYFNNTQEMLDHYINSNNEYYGPLVNLMRVKDMFMNDPKLARQAYAQIWNEFGQDTNKIIENLDKAIEEMTESKMTSPSVKELRQKINIPPAQQKLLEERVPGLAIKNANLFNIKDNTAKTNLNGTYQPLSSKNKYTGVVKGVSQLGVDDEGHAIFQDYDSGTLAGIDFIYNIYSSAIKGNTNTLYGKLTNSAYDSQGRIKLRDFRNKYAESKNADDIIAKMNVDGVKARDTDGNYTEKITANTTMADIKFEDVLYYFALFEDHNLLESLGGKPYIKNMVDKYMELIGSSSL